MAGQENKFDFISEVRNIASQSGTSHPASSIVKNIDVATTISKLVKPRERGLFKPSDPESNAGLTNSGVELISKTIMGRVEDNENIFKLFPDIELAAQIVISSVLSPKDMVNSELIYRTKTCSLPPQLVTKMVTVVKEAVEIEYKLKDSLNDILRMALFKTGSYVTAILPEAAVDHLINQPNRITTESISSSDLFSNTDMTSIKSIGLLADPRPAQETGKISRRVAIENSINSKITTYNAGIYVSPEREKEDKEAIVNAKAFSKFITESLEVTDNFQFLKMPKLLEAVNSQAVSRLTNSRLKQSAEKFATEAFNHRKEKKATISAKELETTIYKSPKTDYKPFIVVPSPMNLVRKSAGKPLVLNLPSEATIPVYVPGDPSNHVGYFIAVDDDGNPVTVSSANYDAGHGLNSMLNSEKSNTSMAGLLTDKARRNLGSDGFVPMLDHMSEIYADLIESDLLERLAKGAYGKKLQISKSNEIYRIMLARALQSQFTRLVYIPADYVSYFAFNYHRNGVGKSYLDDLSNITSLRAMVLFSKVMAKVKSSISTTSVHVELDPREVDPVKTIEMAKHFVARARQQYFPHGLNRVVDLTDWIQTAGIEISFSGHPRLPTTKFEFESKNIQHTEPDDTLDEMFRHQTYMHFGLSPETVDSAAKADFATTIEQNSVLFARRIMMLSHTFTGLLTEHIQRIITHDESIQDRLAEILNENKGEVIKTMDDEEKALFESDQGGFTKYLLNYFIELFEVDLPKPDSTRNASLKTAMENQESMVDKGLDYIFSETILPPEFAGDSASYVKSVREAWKGAIMRAWMADNNYLPELFEITNRNQEGKPMADLLEITKSYTENVMLNIVSFLESMRASKAAVNKDLGAMNLEPGSDLSSSDTSTTDEGGGDGMGDFGGGDEGGNPFDDIPEVPGSTDEATSDNNPDDTTAPEESKPDEPEAKKEETENKDGDIFSKISSPDAV